MVKCLVTGGKGFIGSHLVNYLVERGHWVRNVDIKANSYLPTTEHEFLQGDLRAVANCEQATEEIEWVFALASNMGGIDFITKKHAEVMHDNVLINAQMLQASIEAEVKRFFFSSSACVYPAQLQSNNSIVVNLKETDAYPAFPGTAYGWEKLFTEQMCASYAEDSELEVRIARYHNIYGPYGTYKGGREKAPAALCRKVAKAPNGGKIQIWGDGNQIRSFLYISDCLDATYKLMTSNYSTPLNIGSDQGITITTLADLIIKISGKELEKRYDLTKPQGVRHRNADISLARRELGWTPKVDLEAGVAQTYHWIEEMEARK